MMLSVKRDEGSLESADALNSPSTGPEATKRRVPSGDVHCSLVQTDGLKVRLASVYRDSKRARDATQSAAPLSATKSAMRRSSTPRRLEGILGLV